MFRGNGRVFKLKRAVHVPDLDVSTTERRHAMCRPGGDERDARPRRRNVPRGNPLLGDDGQSRESP
ncbi:hypothetical protein ASF20_11435 [Methylobacterium sp. Leaf88]|nr:hypothetical protein ASF20_11435 [Methylobacterium sp. Leaf88]